MKARAVAWVGAGVEPQQPGEAAVRQAVGATARRPVAVALLAALAAGLALSIPDTAAAAPTANTAVTPADRRPPAAAMPAAEDSMAQRAKACTGCHGPQGRSRPDGYVPRLAGKPAGYLHEQLRAFQEGRRRHEGMARMLEHLSDDMLQALAGHFASLELPYPAPVAVPLTATEARRAEQLVRQGDTARGLPACAACHGAALAGVAPHVPGLLGLPVDYLNGQLGAWRQGHRRAREPDCMATVARELPLADVALVARWLATQPVPAGLHPATTPPATWPLRCGSIGMAPRP